MTYKTAIFDLDGLVARMGFGLTTLGAVQAAMAERALGEDESIEAIYGVYDHLRDVCASMRELVNTAIEDGRYHGE